MTSTETFLRQRDLLLAHREDYEAAYRLFSWPQLDCFNWALDHFDVMARGNQRTALWIVSEGADRDEQVRLSFAELSERSSRVANFLRRLGMQRGDRLLLMLPNQVPLFEVMLAAMKLGAVVIPSTPLCTRADIEDRLLRGQVRHVVTDIASVDKLAGLDNGLTRIVTSGREGGWVSYDDAYQAPALFTPEVKTRADDLLLLYFTSGTTARPKLVPHTHQSYPVGHLSTMYYIGLREGDVHCNISSPGWAKHAWSSFFAPWNAGATVFVPHAARFSAPFMLRQLAERGIDTLCAPPTVWRMLILEDLQAYRGKLRLRELVSAGEPLNPEVIEKVRAAWGLTVRDGYGQTETTALVGNTPGQPLTPGSMGRPLPGYQVVLLDRDGREVTEGEVALHLSPRPLGLTTGPAGTHDRTYYHTGDEATRDAHGCYFFVGRGDDVFKSSDYRISPFELESVLIEHECVAEAAVIASPDPVRLSVPKAFIVPRPGVVPDRALAAGIFRFLRERLASYKRVRRLEFAELPKTISGKIRRVELRQMEERRRKGGLADGTRAPLEFWEEDFAQAR